MKHYFILLSVLLLTINFGFATELELPSGEVVDLQSTQLAAKWSDYFDVKLQESKQYFVDSFGEDHRGDLYSGMRSIKRYKEEDPTHILHTVDISNAEIVAMVSYSEWSYQGINSFLWSPDIFDYAGEAKERVEAEISAMISGLNKLPVFAGTVYRCDQAKYWEHLISGAQTIFDYQGFMSTTIGSGVDARNSYMNPSKCSVIFTIKSISGRPLYYFTTRPWEEEVLFLPKSKFKVQSVVSKTFQEEGQSRKYYEIAIEQLQSP
ncbi:MAG: hypothetical protein ISR65_18195 [Bacteriovoracaceae bacterium]|nr:hypothetical protein [Bacteriovoracaceae bacterium]